LKWQITTAENRGEREREREIVKTLHFKQNSNLQPKLTQHTRPLTCFLMGLSKIKGALSLVKVVTKGSLLANTNSAILDFTN
jgi:hypothetical protein